MPSPFISVDDLTDYLGRDVTADAGAVVAVDSACEICRTLAEQTFNKVVGDRVTLDGTGTDALLLPELPVSTVGTVVVNGGTVADYRLNDNGVLFRTAGTATSWDWPVQWPAGRQNIAVTYDHGGTAVPSDVRMVALTIASRLVIQGVAQSEVLGSQQIRYGTNSTDFTAGERAILRKYKRAR